MPSNNYKRSIRAKMAETGLNYMRAKRIVDEERARREAGDELASVAEETREWSERVLPVAAETWPTE